VVTQPGNERPGHPGWCRADKPDPFEFRHLSAGIRVGVRRNGGEASVWLVQSGNQKPLIKMVAAQMTSATVEISLAHAAELRDGLTDLLQAAGYE
jgi:hypothetical protein